MAKESTQHKLDRVRSPRVHITYDVEIGDAIELKELPFVMGVLGDLTGQPEQPLAALKDRKFVEINPDNFDSVLKGMQPHLAYSVANKLSDDPNAGQLKVDLQFREPGRFLAGERGEAGGAAEGAAGSADAAFGSARQPAGQRQAGRGAVRSGLEHGEPREAASAELGKTGGAE